MRSKRTGKVQSRYILHVDMDAFYASVEQLDHPELKGRSVIVGGRPEARGVVSAASYEARKFGVHSAMPMRTAVRLCPEAVLLPVRMERYHELSEKLCTLFESYTPLVETISLDEAFLDVTGSLRLFGSAEKIAREIKVRIRTELGLTASVGVAPNKFLAKLASDWEKPDGLVVIIEEEKEEKISDLPASRLWGVGEATLKELEKLGVRTIGEVRALGRELLEEKFGKAGSWIYDRSRGIDESEVTPDREAKSVGAETTFPEDIADLEALERTLLELAERVGFRLRDAGVKARTITLKVRFANFQTVTRSLTREDPTSSTSEIYRKARWLLVNRVKLGRKAVRLLGITTSQFAEGGLRQQSLFPQAEDSKLERLEETINKIRLKLGRQALKRGRLLEK